jgi:sister-chromatid-cohesion protein PDS5
MKEDNIFKVSLYKVENLKKADLLSHLNDLHKKLATIGQEDRPKGLNDVATHLIKRPLLSNSDRDVRLVSLCCLVDILRIYAPEAPFRDEDVIDVFEAIITQFRGLSTIKIDSATGALIFYLLNSLSAVKSCVIPVLLSQAGVRGASEVVASLFQTLLNAAHNDQSEAGKFLKLSLIKHADIFVFIFIRYQYWNIYALSYNLV